MLEINTDLFDFAYCPKEKYNELSELAQPEKWDGNQGNQNSILLNYIRHTFRKLATDRNLSPEENQNEFVYIDNDLACFNTGLVTPKYKNIYAYFEKNKYKEGNPKEWYLKSFEVDSSYTLETIKNLPGRAKFFRNIEELIYDTSKELRVNIAHILEDEENKERLPNELKGSSFLVTLFEGAITLAKKIVDLNYKAAVPQYFNGKIQFLLPINLLDPEKTNLALAVELKNGFYSGRTCLTLDMAYNNARLIAKPTEWLSEPNLGPFSETINNK